MAMNTRSVQRALNSMMGGRHAQNGYINRGEFTQFIIVFPAAAQL